MSLLRMTTKWVRYSLTLKEFRWNRSLNVDLATNKNYLYQTLTSRIQSVAHLRQLSTKRSINQWCETIHSLAQSSSTRKSPCPTSTCTLSTCPPLPGTRSSSTQPSTATHASTTRSISPGHDCEITSISCHRVNTNPGINDYTVVWICALKTELDAAVNSLDHLYEWGFGPEPDHNLYILGRIAEHNVVLTCLPMGKYGNNAAGMVATRMMSTFTNIKLGLIVGIGGGLPSEKDDIRLGDVVVGKPNMQHGGIIQYDMGKFTSNGFQVTGFLPLPPERLLSVMNMMPSHGAILPKPQSALYPGEKRDQLHKYDYEHVNGRTAHRFNEQKLVKRCPGRRKYGPRVFYGTIASGNALIKDSITRDNLVQKNEALCFEMEAAGLVNSSFPCLVVRGISDYADSHKNDIWQEYAAAAAARYAKDFLHIFPGNI